MAGKIFVYHRRDDNAGDARGVLWRRLDNWT